MSGLCSESLSRVRLFVTPWTAARQAPPSTGILQVRILEWLAMPSSSLFWFKCNPNSFSSPLRLRWSFPLNCLFLLSVSPSLML